MEKRIELEKRGRPSSQITELNLDNCRSTNIVGLTDEFTGLETLSLINVGLTTLKGFPKLANLKKLELSDNRISNGLSNLITSTNLTHLNLSGNKIKDLEELKALENFKSLMVLDLFNNEATSIDSYREKIFAMIPSLVYLDGFDANEVEALSDGYDDDEINENDSDADEVSDEGDEIDEDDDDGEEEEDDDDDDGVVDVSLAEVYNDDLEEDNSDYVEEGDGEEVDGEEDDDIDSDEDEAIEKAPGQPQQPAEEESPARGKKRKHDV